MIRIVVQGNPADDRAKIHSQVVSLLEIQIEIDQNLLHGAVDIDSDLAVAPDRILGDLTEILEMNRAARMQVKA